MKRFILSVIIATGFHIAILAFSPSILKKNNDLPTPETKQVLVTLSYRQPVKKTADKPDIQKKETPRTDEMERVIPEPEIRPKPQPVTEPEAAVEPEPVIEPEPVVEPEPMIEPEIKIEPETMIESKIDPKPENKKSYPMKKKVNPVKKIETPHIKIAKKNPEKQVPLMEKTISQAKQPIPQKESLIEFAKPLYKKNPLPVYPAIAKRRGYQGIVELKVLVSEKGKVSAIKILKSSGYKSLDRQAVSTVKNWHFEPGKKNDIIQSVWVKIPVKFELK